MPMLIVDDEDFELELKRCNGSKNNSTIIKMPKMGRPDGCIETPETLRKLIAGDAIDGIATAKEIAKEYGVSMSSVNAYKGDSTSTDRMVNKVVDSDLKKHNDNKRKKLNSLAHKVSRKALEHITDEKLKASKATDLSQIAANAARVIDKTTPKDGGNTVTNNIHFYSPQQIRKENFEVVEAEVIAQR